MKFTPPIVVHREGAKLQSFPMAFGFERLTPSVSVYRPPATDRKLLESRRPTAVHDEATQMELAGLLGRSHWGAQERRILRTLLVLAGNVDVVLAAVEQAPREEVIHEAAEVLAELADHRAAQSLCDLLSTASVVARATVARALGYATSEGTHDLRRNALLAALTQSEAEVRDAAVAAVASLEDPAVVPALRDARDSAQEDYIREAIDETIDELT
ncbi:MAG: HEAT repeat domain-containing protein [Myxococcota bacterium]